MLRCRVHLHQRLQLCIAHPVPVLMVQAPMTILPSYSGRREVTEFLAYAGHPDSQPEVLALKIISMWTQKQQREKLRRLSPEARAPVLKFLQDRPPLIRNLQRDSPHLREALLLAVDAVGQVHACMALFKRLLMQTYLLPDSMSVPAVLHKHLLCI